ncbi:MAG TPA: hypothetical protein VN450_08240 [Candidatus Methylomirabilis sp.]|nr:hypothetical protein [Candidatus Methylomirabilis sp.]
MRRILLLVVVMFLATALRVEAGSLAGIAPGSFFSRADADEFGGAEIVPVEELESTRGGYKAGTDLMFSFGIEKAVYVNGVLEASSTLNLLSPGAGGGFSQVPFPGTLIQIGNPGDPNTGSNFSAISPGDFRGIILQNSLDQQRIANITKISVGLNVLGAYRENHLSGILNQQLFRSIR